MTPIVYAGWVFLIILGMLWTRAGYMNRSQGRGITNILFYALIPAMLIHVSQTADSTADLTLPLVKLTCVSIICALILCLLNQLRIYRSESLLGPEFKFIHVTAAILTGTAVSFLLGRYNVFLPAVLASPLDMLSQTVIPVGMFLIGNAIACAIGFTKGGRV